MRTYVYFEVIDIVDDKTSYLALLGIVWAIDNQTIINFKKRILSFEDSELRLIAPIDMIKGRRYDKPVNNEGEGDYPDHIYNITSARDDYVNSTADKNLTWRSINSGTSDSSEALEN